MDPLVPTPTQSPTWEMLDRYLAGESDAAEALAVRAYLQRRPDAEHHLRTPESYGHPQMSHVPHTPDWGRMATRLREGEIVEGRLERPRHDQMRGRPASSPAWRFVRVAGVASLAVAFLAVGAGVWRHVTRSADAASQQYATRVGQRMTVRLADGSHVTLAPRTTLRIAPGYGRAGRTVTLDGEAYFNVAPSAQAPFVVHTGRVVTRVLGTQFNVRRYPADTAVQVVVTSGRVAVGVGATPAVAVVSAGMIAELTDSTVATQEKGEVAQYTTWLNGRLVFQDAPIHAVLEALTRWYGYDFRVADSALAAQRVTVWLSTESGDRALASLLRTVGATMTRDGNVVTLTPSKSARAPRAPRRTPPGDAPHLLNPSATEVGR